MPGPAGRPALLRCADHLDLGGRENLAATGECTDPGRRRKLGDAGALCAVGRRLHPIGGSVAALKAQIETLSERWAEHGRAAAEMRVVARSELDLVDSGSADPSTPMVGSLEQVIEAVAAYAEIGVSELVLSISTDDVAHIHRRSDLRNGCCRGSPLDRRRVRDGGPPYS